MIKHFKIIVQFPKHSSEVLSGNLYLGPPKFVSLAWTPVISRLCCPTCALLMGLH